MITGRVTVAEYITVHQLARRRLMLTLNVILALTVLVGSLLLLTASRKLAFIIVLGGLGGFIGEFVQGRIYLPFRCRQLYSQLKGRTDLTYSWNSEILILESNHGNAERPWSDFRKAKENDKVFLLYYHDALFEIVSKRWFKTPEQIDSFRKNLRMAK